MKDTIEIKRDDYDEIKDDRNRSQRDDYVQTKRVEDKRVEKRSKRSNAKKIGIIISLIFIVAGLVWYAVNLGLIPTQFIIQQAGPILIIILGILILIKSL